MTDNWRRLRELEELLIEFKDFTNVHKKNAISHMGQKAVLISTIK